MLKNFWSWYERHLALNIVIAGGLFVLQLLHLYWLTTDVVLFKLTGHQYFEVNNFWQALILLVDYTEIPALLTTSLLYIHDLRQGKKGKSILYLILLNSQWLHLFWITDEYVVEKFFNISGVGIPIILAWIAIMIDYLELPVIFDTLRRMLGKDGLKVLLEKD